MRNTFSAAIVRREKLLNRKVWREPVNMEVAVEALRNGDIGLNAAPLACPLQEDT